MREFYIKKVATWTEPAGDDGSALEGLRQVLGRRVARRMTRLGMMVTQVLKPMAISEATSLVYATTYSEAGAIEKFLNSFPFPSPQMFQTSIHPSGAEQYLIQQQQAVTEFYPLAGHEDLLLRALDCMHTCAGESLVLCGGEEVGTWLLEAGISSTTNYAWALELSHCDAGAIGCVRWEEGAGFSGAAAVLPRFVDALQARAPFRVECAEGSYVELEWSE